MVLVFDNNIGGCVLKKDRDELLLRTQQARNLSVPKAELHWRLANVVGDTDRKDSVLRPKAAHHWFLISSYVNLPFE
jgi:hypothetical protein